LDSSLDPSYLSFDPIATLTTSPQTITGLTAGTKYHLKVHDQRTAYGIVGYDDITSDVQIYITTPRSNMDFQVWYESPVCGFEFRKRDLHKRWDGLLVCWKDLDERNPQDTHQ
jgi:hypothetical protein